MNPIQLLFFRDLYVHELTGLFRGKIIDSGFEIRVRVNRELFAGERTFKNT